MATNLPNALKSADISRFVTRAAQVEKAKPVVAYWCNYWIVSQILSKGLHTADDETMTYTIMLMDKLEQTKAENAQNDAILDDVAGQAYVEQFGNETFQRADNAVRANKASRQTADTFQAAATFFDLSRIWAPLNPEISSKIKFAKYHALRIAKALKAGEDPNLSNPTPEPSPTQELPPLDPNDPDVQALNGRPSSSHQSTDNFRQPSVEDVPDDNDQLGHRTVRGSTLNQSLNSPRAPSIQSTPMPEYSSRREGPSPPTAPGEEYYQGTTNGEVSPLEPLATDRTASIGGSYFPNVPDGYSDEKPLVLPEAPPADPGSPPAVDLTKSSLSPSLQVFDYSAPDLSQTLPDTPNQSSYNDSTAAQGHPPPPHQPLCPTQPPVTPIPKPPPMNQRPQHPGIASPQPTRPQPIKPQPAVEKYNEDDESRSKAFKVIGHARSALDFEDVPTAVKLLRDALKMLGAQ